jgi:uncharacterized protein
MTKNIIAAFLLAIGVALSGFFISNGFVLGKKADRVVTVKGLAEQIVKADEGIWHIYFAYGSDDLAELYRGVANSQQTIAQFLQDQAFSADEMSVQSISITDKESGYYGGNDNTKRFVAESGITLHTSKVDQVNQAVQQTGQLVQHGVLIRRSEVVFNFTSLNAIKLAMLNAATTNAAAAAATFAENSQSQLGKIRNASQGLFTIADATTGGGSYGSDIMKKVRVVTTVQYYLR